MKRRTIRINDRYGKSWIFQEDSIDGFYFDNSQPNDWVIITVGGVKIKTYKWALAVALPKVVEEMDININ